MCIGDARSDLPNANAHNIGLPNRRALDVIGPEIVAGRGGGTVDVSRGFLLRATHHANNERVLGVCSGVVGIEREDLLELRFPSGAIVNRPQASVSSRLPNGRQLGRYREPVQNHSFEAHAEFRRRVARQRAEAIQPETE